jgi:hypothetical protein
MVRHQAALASGQLTRGTSGVNLPPSEVIMSRGLDCKIVQSNPLIPILRGMSKGAKMQAIFRDGQFLRVWR